MTTQQMTNELNGILFSQLMENKIDILVSPQGEPETLNPIKFAMRFLANEPNRSDMLSPLSQAIIHIITKERDKLEEEKCPINYKFSVYFKELPNVTFKQETNEYAVHSRFFTIKHRGIYYLETKDYM